MERNCCFIIQRAYSFLAIIKAQETEKELVRVYEQRHNCHYTESPASDSHSKGSVDLNSVSNLTQLTTDFQQTAFQNSQIFIDSKIKYIIIVMLSH